jgi:putative oxidoreductase
MFSTFPDGWPGAGLLLLRAAAGAGLFAQGIAYFSDKRDLAPLILAVALFTVCVGTLLLIGCLTRFTALLAALAGVAGMLSWFPGPNVGLFENRMTAALAVVIVAAVVCLGPGAFSVDARLFGRREVIIPKNPSAPDI